MSRYKLNTEYIYIQSMAYLFYQSASIIHSDFYLPVLRHYSHSKLMPTLLKIEESVLIFRFHKKMLNFNKSLQTEHTEKKSSK